MRKNSLRHTQGSDCVNFPSSASHYGEDWFSYYNASCDVDIQSVGCWLVDSQTPGREGTSSRKHYWGQMLYLGALTLKVFYSSSMSYWHIFFLYKIYFKEYLVCLNPNDFISSNFCSCWSSYVYSRICIVSKWVFSSSF